MALDSFYEFPLSCSEKGREFNFITQTIFLFFFIERPLQINELMATTSDELEQYRQIDRERVASEADMARKKGLRRWNRLMPADEVRFGFWFLSRARVRSSSGGGLAGCCQTRRIIFALVVAATVYSLGPFPVIYRCRLLYAKKQKNVATRGV